MAECMACHKTLTVYVEPDSADDDDDDESMGESTAGQYVPDDVELQCGCHFHWQCLLDSYSMNNCPNCGGNLISTTPSGAEQLVCNLENEGGLQERLDILSILREESYLQAFPEERIGLAFLSFCGEGDIEACVDLLKSTELDVLRYQDGLGTMCSGLHVAVQKQRVDVAWLLLLLASNLDISQFPAAVLQAAEGMGLTRDEDPKEDIRSLRNADGVTAEQQAAGIGGVWSEWLQAGLLSPSNG